MPFINFTAYDFACYSLLVSRRANVRLLTFGVTAPMMVITRVQPHWRNRHSDGIGAQRGAVVRMVLREVLVTAALGLVVGMSIALAASKFVESFLYRMKSNDHLALTPAALTLLSAALLAGYVPAWRASRIDPLTAIRHELVVPPAVLAIQGYRRLATRVMTDRLDIVSSSLTCKYGANADEPRYVFISNIRMKQDALKFQQLLRAGDVR